MNKLKIRGVLILLVLVVGLIYAIPSFLGKAELPQGWIGPKSKLKLGLDLQGGIHLVLKVDSIKAVGSRLNSIAADLKTQMINDRIHYGKVAPSSTDTLLVELRNKDEYDALTKLVTDAYPFLTETNTDPTPDGGTAVTYQMKAVEAQKIREQAVQQALETIRNRIS